jgi:hypothetical protein
VATLDHKLAADARPPPADICQNAWRVLFVEHASGDAAHVY